MSGEPIAPCSGGRVGMTLSGVDRGFVDQLRAGAGERRAEIKMADGRIVTGTLKRLDVGGMTMVVDIVHFTGWGSIKRVTCAGCLGILRYRWQPVTLAEQFRRASERGGWLCGRDRLGTT